MSGFLSNSVSTSTINAISETTATPNSIPRSLDTGLLDPSWTAIEEVVSVAMGGARFTSIKAAVDSITDASAIKPYSIRVYPGVYYEDTITMKPFVSIRGFGSPIDAIVHANDLDNNFITASGASYIEKLSVHGPTAENKACFYSGSPILVAPFFVNDCIINDGYIGILDNSSGAGVSMQVNNVLVNSANTTTKKFLCVGSYGSITSFNCQCFSAVTDGVSRGVCVDGANAFMKLNSFTFSGCPGSVAVNIDNGATVRLNNSILLKGHTAIYIGPGGSSSVAVGSTNISATPTEYFTDYNIRIDSPLAKVSFYGKADKEKISVATGATFTASFLDIYQDPGESYSTPGQVVFGELWLGTQSESVPLRSYSVKTFSSGYASGGELTRGIGLKINIAAGTGFINTGTGVTEVDWDAGSVDLTSDSTNYIYVEDDGTLASSIVEPDYADVVLLGIAYANSVDIVFLTYYYAKLPQYRSEMLEYLESVIGPISVSGCTVTKHGLNSTEVDVDSGSFYISNIKKTVDGYYAAPFRYWWQDGSGDWQQSDFTTDVDTTRYNTGGALAATTPGKFKKDLLYVSKVDGTAEYHMVYGQEEFVDAATAILGNNPGAPDVLTKQSLRIAGIIQAAGDSKITSVVDARPVLGQLSTGTTAVSDHGSLGGLSDDDHSQYQLRTEKGNANGYAELDASGLVPAAQLNLAILAPVDVTKSAALVGDSETLARQNHKHDISTAAPIAIGVANTEGDATSLARSNHVHDHGSQTVGTLHAVATTLVNGFLSSTDKSKLDGILSNTAPENVTKSAASAGAASDAARRDHKHDITTAAPVAIGTANAEGDSASLARSNHVHKGTLLQTSFSEITVDTTVASTSGFVDLLSITLTTGANSVLVHFTACGDNTNNTKITTYILVIDGVTIRGSATQVSPNVPDAAALVYKAAVTAASHTIKIQWSASANTSRIRPVTNPNTNHASLLIQEVSV